MPIRILRGDIHLIDLQTRLPFKYGIATMTRAPQAFVRLFVDVNGRKSTGIAADLLPPKWFTKVPDKPLADEIDEMLAVIDHAVGCAEGVEGPTVFEIWQQVFERQDQWGRAQGFPPLLSQFGTTLVERALIEAYCLATGRPFSDAVRANDLGIQLQRFDSRLTNSSPRDLLPRQPRRRIIARHTVGMADPLEDADIEESARLNDGLPQSLSQCIRHYGLKHFKLKVSGNADHDIPRLTRISTIIERSVASEFSFTLDGNESFHSLESFREYWLTFHRTASLSAFLKRMMFIEQPFHRDVALSEGVLHDLPTWTDRPTLIIDESDAELDSFARALSLGYHGTSHKNCKGVFKGIANACLLELLKRQSGNHHLVMSGEDLANIGPIALLQDLAVVATLGVTSVERNGHHYFAGLSAFSKTIQEQILHHHSDLYQQTPSGWPSLRIAGGELTLDSIVDSPLGVGFELDPAQFIPRAAWKTPSI